jgi:hypothetical protein
MCLLVHSSAAQEVEGGRGVDAATLRAWFMEYWAACYRCAASV